MKKKQSQVENRLSNRDKPLVRGEKGLFAPGTAGGPGRPAGSLSITALIRSALEDVPELKGEGGKDLNPQKKKWVEMFITRLLQQAIARGDRSTQKLIWNYIDGMPKGSLDLTTLGEKVNTFDEKQIHTIASRILNGDSESEE